MRLMSMRMPPNFAALAVLLLLPACGSQSASLAADVNDSTRARLLAAADAAAKNDGGEAKRVEAGRNDAGQGC